eukprot:2801493-Rhodomonas_salina.1
MVVAQRGEEPERGSSWSSQEERVARVKAFAHAVRAAVDTHTHTRRSQRRDLIHHVMLVMRIALAPREETPTTLIPIP